MHNDFQPTANSYVLMLEKQSKGGGAGKTDSRKVKEREKRWRTRGWKERGVRGNDRDGGVEGKNDKREMMNNGERERGRE